MSEKSKLLLGNNKVGTLHKPAFLLVFGEGNDKSGCKNDDGIPNDVNVGKETGNTQLRQRNRSAAEDENPSSRGKSTPKKVPQLRRQKVKYKWNESH